MVQVQRKILVQAVLQRCSHKREQCTCRRRGSGSRQLETSPQEARAVSRGASNCLSMGCNICRTDIGSPVNFLVTNRKYFFCYETKPSAVTDGQCAYVALKLVLPPPCDHRFYMHTQNDQPGNKNVLYSLSEGVRLQSYPLLGIVFLRYE